MFPLASGTGLTDPSGQTIQTIPFFATNAVGSNDYNGAAANGNIRSVQIPSGSDQVYAYYGCFLDVFNPDNSAKFGGTHHCVVAQIAYDGAPIPTSTVTGATPNPFNWDKLAQRNLQITRAEDPTAPATHFVPQAFDLRPSRPIAANPSSLAGLPDELMIDWGNTPVGSTASIYWPSLKAADVLILANQVYSSHLLLAADINTLQCIVTRGVTYIPIPPLASSVANFAGLFTVALPDTIKDGEFFRIVIRRIASRPIVIRKASSPPRINVKKHQLQQHSLPDLAHDSHISPASSLSESTVTHQRSVLEARPRDPSTKPRAIFKPSRSRIPYVRQTVGLFQVSIPVVKKTDMLWPEQNTLAVLKWRLEHMDRVNRWYPVLTRYVELVSARVAGLGGEPGKVPPTLGGVPAKHPPGHERCGRHRRHARGESRERRGSPERHRSRERHGSRERYRSRDRHYRRESQERHDSREGQERHRSRERHDRLERQGSHERHTVRHRDEDPLSTGDVPAVNVVYDRSGNFIRFDLWADGEREPLRRAYYR